MPEIAREEVDPVLSRRDVEAKAPLVAVLEVGEVALARRLVEFAGRILAGQNGASIGRRVVSLAAGRGCSR